MFCILYGLCGIPLCLVWISELGSFFGDRAKRLSQVMIRKGISVVRNLLKAVSICLNAVFLLILDEDVLYFLPSVRKRSS